MAASGQRNEIHCPTTDVQIKPDSSVEKCRKGTHENMRKYGGWRSESKQSALKFRVLSDVREDYVQHPEVQIARKRCGSEQ